MDLRKGVKLRELTALLIAPNRFMAEEFSATLSESRAFQILVDLKTYPTRHALEMRLRQVGPDVVLVDVETDRDRAEEVVRFVAGFNPPVQVVGLSPKNDPELLLTSLRLGASEFLNSPFPTEVQLEAVGRLIRLRQPDPVVTSQPGTIVMFTSAKPGSGASTLSIQSAFALRRVTSKRILLVDFDLLGGSVGFYSKLSAGGSLLEGLLEVDQLSPSVWSSLVSDLEGVDVLAGPETPFVGNIEPARLAALFEYARMHYDWILLDLPVVFQRFSLMALSHADRALIVSTCELPSLHFARKAVQLLEQLGFPKERFQIALNRVTRREDLGRSEIEKLFQCPVYSKHPSDYFSLHRAVTLGKPLDVSCDLGKTFEELASRLSGSMSAPAADRVSQLVMT